MRIARRAARTTRRPWTSGRCPRRPSPRTWSRSRPREQLGKDIFFDSTLSAPAGYACATCHAARDGLHRSELRGQCGWRAPCRGSSPGRFGKRKPQAVSYSTYSPFGPYFDADLQVWLGGTFWDGRTPDNAAQARMPFLDQNEMANAATGPYPPHAGGFSSLVAQKLAQRPYADLFREVSGAGVFALPDAAVYDLATRASRPMRRRPRSTRSARATTPPSMACPPTRQYRLTASEENGRRLFFGKAQCSACHSSATLEPVLAATAGKDVFTMYCYANIGVPKNPQTPSIRTDSVSNPAGFNPLGAAFIDLGLGTNPNPAPDGTVFMNVVPGDIPAFRGLFKAPSVRNADKRPTRGFVKSYMHNGTFKSLEQVVHFYNKRNIAANRPGPRGRLRPAGRPPGRVREALRPARGARQRPERRGGLARPRTHEVEPNGQVGHLGLSAREEADIVNFLKTLTDGYTRPNPPPAR